MKGRLNYHKKPLQSVCKYFIAHYFLFYFIPRYPLCFWLLHNSRIPITILGLCLQLRVHIVRLRGLCLSRFVVVVAVPAVAVTVAGCKMPGIVCRVGLQN